VAKRKTNLRPHKGNVDALSSFLASVDRFTETISAQAAAVAPAGEQRIVIQSTGESFVAQTRKLTDYVREAAAEITPGQRQELDQFLRVQDGDALVNRAVQVSAKMLSPGGGPVTMSFLSWLDEIMNTLKKILSAIVDLIFGGNMPDWINTILVIIDELLNLLKTLLGGVFGLRMSQVADELSREEVNFLHEMSALAQLQAVRRSGRIVDDENSS
jgi:hypothetical protein